MATASCACGCRWQLRDVRVGEERRTKPLHRWVGPVPCACVRQAIAVFSLQNTPSPAEWPEYIGHLELALQATRPAPAPHAPLPSPDACGRFGGRPGPEP